LPQEQCEAFDANDIQNILVSSSSVSVADVLNFNVSCCDEDVCDRPSLPDLPPEPENETTTGNVDCSS